MPAVDQAVEKKWHVRCLLNDEEIREAKAAAGRENLSLAKFAERSVMAEARRINRRQPAESADGHL